jgi:hypothetical protein
MVRDANPAGSLLTMRVVVLRGREGRGVLSRMAAILNGLKPERA